MLGMTLEKTLRWVAIVGIFSLPFIVLIVSRTLFFPFITGKNFTFRIIVEIVGSAWLALALISPLYRPRRSWILLAITSFVLVIGVADLFGVYPMKSIWSNYERMEGWVTLAHLFVYFLAAVSLLSTEKLWKRWWQTSLAVSAMVAFYGLLQLAGYAVINQGGVRLDATLGNATYLAVYMLFHIFIAALYLSKSWMEDRGGRPVAVFVYGSLIIVETLVLFFTATRGAMLGLIGGSLLASAILIIQAPRSRVAWRAGVGVVLAIVILGAIWLGRDSEFVKRLEPLQRLATLSFSESTIKSRFMNVGMALKGFKERPTLGWGQENYAIVFDKYYDPRMHGQEPWFDRVHNVVFDWLAAGGILGLLAYLSLYGAALFALWRGTTFLPYERALITGLLAGYLFYLLFTFDNIVSYLLFVSLLAYIATRSSMLSRPLFEKSSVSTSLLPFLAALVVIAVWGVAWFVNAHALAANKFLIRGLSPQQEGLMKNLEHFKQSIAYGTYGTQEAREHLSQSAAQFASNTQVPTDVRQALLSTTVEEMQKQMQEAPRSARFPFFLGILLNAYGDYENARVALTRAHELSPNKQSILFELGINALARGDSASALQIFKQAYELEPEFADARIFYTAVAIHVGDVAVENEMITIVLEHNQELEPRILSAYATKGRFDKIAQLAAAYIGEHPDEVHPRLTYAAALYKMGEPERAIAALQELKLARPDSSAQADALIAEIRAGTLQIQ